MKVRKACPKGYDDFSVMLCNKRLGLRRLEVTQRNYCFGAQAIMDLEFDSAEWDTELRRPIFYIDVEDDKEFQRIVEEFQHD